MGYSNGSIYAPVSYRHCYSYLWHDALIFNSGLARDIITVRVSPLRKTDSKPRAGFCGIGKSERIMAYSSGLLNKRVTILNKKNRAELGFGETTKYEAAGCVWANVTWKKGQKALNEGALDSIDTVMIRMRWNTIVNRDSRLECEGVMYQIQSLHADMQENTVQITATEIVNN